ncbi:pro-thyrotropin-releasing hormone [Syngnathoides biaculeatus]|uniref:pro-thyrotropin-releasing hormone n=1 Tax=Syngnathoides biaculeatus TaxID=300417 RepID=UPI002ADDA9ED|nr:pro-thyrotropin-releasing hormone [Syngnathoides biaculeatus]
MLCAQIEIGLTGRSASSTFGRPGAKRSPPTTSRGLRETTMKATCVFLLVSLLVCDWGTTCRARGVFAEDAPDPAAADDLLLRRAESLLLRSILRKMRAEDRDTEGPSPQTEWVTKRQHPGKRYREDLDQEDEADGEFLPGVERRQHPGRRATTGHLSDLPAIVAQGELAKRQHPGKRDSALRGRRQHPGKRQPEEEEEEEDDDDDDDDEEEEEEDRGDGDLPELDKRQHPGKRLWDRPQVATTSPCEDVSDLVTCAESNLLLLQFLDDIDKRQHPGKRFAPADDDVFED